MWVLQADDALSIPWLLPLYAGWQALFLTVPGGTEFHRLRFLSEIIDLSEVANQDVVASIDFRTFENSSGSNWEDPDYIEAWLEGSRDGVWFERFAGSIVTKGG